MPDQNPEEGPDVEEEEEEEEQGSGANPGMKPGGGGGAVGDALLLARLSGSLGSMQFLYIKYMTEAMMPRTTTVVNPGSSFFGLLGRLLGCGLLK